ncbi:MAG: amidohydrolase family protein, partial [Crocinitomicaceae bacterium]|nr:amidohydrolase family protein [Crocinitomicaceae bacterium]
LVEATQKCAQEYEHANYALGIHSLRGVDPVCVKEICLQGNKNVPLHIHISEQLKEVSDSLDYLGKRPVEWMLENCEMDERFHLVHATHVNEHELKGIAKSGASVVLCPSTEGNLGDGIFPLREYVSQNGNWSIGTDSHIGLNPMEELRILDYGQRLISHKRNTFYKKSEGNSGKIAIESITKNGRSAMNNFTKEYFKPGDYLSAALFDAEHPLIASSSHENLINTMIYAGDVSMQKGVFSCGKWIDYKQNSESKNKIHSDFFECIRRLSNR